MCGFVVWYNKKNNVNSVKLEQAILLQKHRGPDFSSSIYFDKNYKKTKKKSDKIKIGFTHKRLSIIDLSNKSNQPFIGNDNRNCLVYNGEIYNYLELKNLFKDQKIVSTGDTEILYNILLKHNENFMNELIGMWAFVFFIFDRKQLIFSRDRVGQKPLYFYNDEDNLIISSEAKSIFFILHGSGKRKVNDNYLLNFFNTGRLSQVIPFYKYIKKVAPGSVATYDLNNNKLHYFQKSFESLTNKNLINYNENDLENELNSSVKMCLRSDRKTAVLLSGGIDSSLISCIAKNYSSNLNFYSLFSSNKNVKKGLKDDIKYANYLADKLGIKLISVPVDDKKELNVDHLKEMARIYDFPLPIRGTSIGLNLLYKKIAEDGIKVILDGTGSDEIFGGYYTLMTENLRNAFISKNLYKIFYAYRKYLIFNFSKANKCLIHSFKAFIKLLLKGDLYHGNIFKNYLKSEYLNISLNSEVSKDFDMGSLPSMQKYEIYRQSLQHFMLYSDSNSMMYSTEARSPFLDARLLKYVNLRTDQKFKNGYNKFALRNILDKYDKKCAWRKDKSGAMINRNSLMKDNRLEIKDIVASSNILKNYLDIDLVFKKNDTNVLLKCLSVACLEDTYNLYS